MAVFAQRAYHLGKVLLGDDGLVAYLEAVVIDGLRRAVQEAGYLGAVVDAEAHQGIDAQVGVEQLALAQHNLLVGTQQGVEVAHEVGIDVEEDGVKRTVELLQLHLDRLGRVGLLLELGQLAGLDFAVDPLAVVVELVDVVGADGDGIEEALHRLGLLYHNGDVTSLRRALTKAKIQKEDKQIRSCKWLNTQTLHEVSCKYIKIFEMTNE